MKRFLNVFLGVLVLLGLGLPLLAGCTPIMASYSLTAYQNATSLKVDTMYLMDKATNKYITQEIAVSDLVQKIDKAYEFAKGIPLNSISAKQWVMLKDPEGNLFGAFLKKWKKDGSLSPVFIEEFKAPIADAFDLIICLEINKKESAQCFKGEGGK